MKNKSDRCSTGHGTGTIMPESTSWPRPRQLGVSGIRSEREKIRDLHVANQKIGELTKVLREDRNEQRARIHRNTIRIRELETHKLALENAAKRSLGARVKAVMSRLFGANRRGKG